MNGPDAMHPNSDYLYTGNGSYYRSWTYTATGNIATSNDTGPTLIWHELLAFLEKYRKKRVQKSDDGLK